MEPATAARAIFLANSRRTSCEGGDDYPQIPAHEVYCPTQTTAAEGYEVSAWGRTRLGLREMLARTRTGTKIGPIRHGMSAPAIDCCSKPPAWWCGSGVCHICSKNLHPAS